MSVGSPTAARISSSGARPAGLPSRSGDPSGTAVGGAAAGAGPLHGTGGESTAPLSGRGLPAYFWVFLAFIGTNMMSGYSKLVGFPIGPDRLCFAGFLVLLVLDRRTWQQRKVKIGFVHLAMVALVVVAVDSAQRAGNLTSGVGGFALLDRLIVPFVLFAVGPLVLSTPTRRDLFLKFGVLVALYLGLTALFELAGPRALIFPRYIADPSVGIHYGRARGPFLEAVANGVVMVQVGFVAGVAAVRFRTWWRYASVLAVLLCSLGVLLTLTRSVWVGAAASVVLVGVMIPRLRRYLPSVVVGGAIAVGALLAFVPSLSSGVNSRVNDQRPIWDRQNTDLAALRIIEQRPLTGIGWEQFVDHGVDFVRQARDYPITATHLEVHNVLLSRGAELGLPGLLLFVAALALGPGRGVLTRARDAEHQAWQVILLGASVAWLAGAMLSPFGTPLPNFLLWLFAGVVLAPATVGRREPVGSREPAGSRQPAGGRELAGGRVPRPAPSSRSAPADSAG